MDRGVVCHAGGSIDGYTITSALEAYEHSYEKGHRFFEVDVSETSDGVLVCSHGWDQSDYVKYFPWETVSAPYQPTLAEFRTYRLGNHLTPMTLKEFIHWIETHKDTYVLLDIKLCDYEMARKIARDVLDATDDKETLSRMVMSARTTDMMRGYCDVYPFPRLHMLYAKDEIREESIYTPEDFLQFCKEYNVSSYSMSTVTCTKELAEALNATGLKSYVYMVQNSYDAARCVSKGIDFVISDYLPADGLDYLQNNGNMGLMAKKHPDGIELTWFPPENATSFTVVRKELEGGEEKEFAVPSTEIPFVDTTTQNDVLYIYCIKAVLDDSDKTAISPEEVYIRGTRPQIERLEETENGVKITWTPRDRALRYRISRKIGEEDYALIKLCDGCEYTDSSLPENVEEPVSYKVNAELTDGHISCYSGYGKAVELNAPPSEE